MRTSLEVETGHLACRWSDGGLQVPSNPQWIQETSDLVPGDRVPH
jgi:hypothetical protein